MISLIVITNAYEQILLKCFILNVVVFLLLVLWVGDGVIVFFLQNKQVTCNFFFNRSFICSVWQFYSYDTMSTTVLIWKKKTLLGKVIGKTNQITIINHSGRGIHYQLTQADVRNKIILHGLNTVPKWNFNMWLYFRNSFTNYCQNHFL